MVLSCSLSSRLPSSRTPPDNASPLDGSACTAVVAVASKAVRAATGTACWRRLDDTPGRRHARVGDTRWHASHGPIDLIVGARAAPDERVPAAHAARTAFEPVLGVLATELPELRRALGARPHRLEGPVARRMLAAVLPHRERSVTPMAAVAGAVADHVLAAMIASVDTLRVAHVNNGGDIALHLAPGESFRVALCSDPRDGRRGATIEVMAGSGVGGIATSGWRGRSHSLGIADAVTVLARTAAAADAAATLIANAVDLPGSARVTRVPARELSPDSDLGDRLVTVDVGDLDAGECERALAPGVALARRCLAAGLIGSVRLELQSRAIIVGDERSNREGRTWIT